MTGLARHLESQAGLDHIVLTGMPWYPQKNATVFSFAERPTPHSPDLQHEATDLLCLELFSWVEGLPCQEQQGHACLVHQSAGKLQSSLSVPRVLWQQSLRFLSKGSSGPLASHTLLLLRPACLGAAWTLHAIWHENLSVFLNVITTYLIGTCRVSRILSAWRRCALGAVCTPEAACDFVTQH